VPTFENGWICRECWSANRETDNRCYRCHATPKYREMPQVATVSETASKPPEERRKVTSLTAPPAPAAPVESVSPAASTAQTPAPELSFFGRLRIWVARMVAAFSWLSGVVRAVPRAPGATKSLVTMRVHAAIGAVTSSLRGLLAHRRAWIALAWAISGVGCALLFSVAFKAPVATSVLVVLGVATFSALTTAMTSNALEHPVESAGQVPQRPQDLNDARQRGFGNPAEQSAQHAEALGSRSAR
jgi:hypothetical protein